MFIENWIYSYTDILAIVGVIICLFIVGYLLFVERGYLAVLVMFLFFAISIAGGTLGRNYYENMTSSVNNAEKTLISSKYTRVEKYKVKTYLLTDNKENAQVILTNGKKIKNVNVKRITKLSTENKTKVNFYDIKLKKKYQPIDKNVNFNKQILIIEKETKGNHVK